MSTPEPDESGQLRAESPTRPYDDAFAIADRLAVHGSDCVCPPCAGRLTGLLRGLARAIPPSDAAGGAG